MDAAVQFAGGPLHAAVIVVCSFSFYIILFISCIRTLHHFSLDLIQCLISPSSLLIMPIVFVSSSSSVAFPPLSFPVLLHLAFNLLFFLFAYLSFFLFSSRSHFSLHSCVCPLPPHLALLPPLCSCVLLLCLCVVLCVSLVKSSSFLSSSISSSNVTSLSLSLACSSVFLLVLVLSAFSN